MRCSICGCTKIDPGESFCGECGHPTSAHVAGDAPARSSSKQGTVTRLLVEKFRNFENDYWHYKMQFSEGHLTREQFEAERKDKTIQDAQGRSWTLRVDDDKWYVNDGQNWVQSEPPTLAAAFAEMPEQIRYLKPLMEQPMNVDPTLNYDSELSDRIDTTIRQRLTGLSPSDAKSTIQTDYEQLKNWQADPKRHTPATASYVRGHFESIVQGRIEDYLAGVTSENQ